MRSRKHEICVEDECESPHYSSGFCRPHYNKNYQPPVVDGEKRCSGCKEWLAIGEFTGINKLSPYCIKCRSIREKADYSKNKDRVTERVEKDRIRRQAANRTLLMEYLSSHPCVDCGESDIVVLEFDHVFGEKKHSICQMIAGYSWANILLEIAKCEVRCANCHRRKTHIQFGYWGAEVVSI